MGAQAKLVLLATAPGCAGVSPGLIPVGGQALISYWTHALKRCIRLLPPHDKVYIVTSPATHGAFVQWASSKVLANGGFPVSNLLQFKDSTGQSAPVQELNFALGEVPALNESYVVVASMDHFLGIDIPLQRLVEHSIIRGKDTLLYTVLPPGHDMEQQTEVMMTGADINPRVTSLALQPVGCADGVSTAALAPMAILHPSTLPLVGRQAASVPGGKQLATLFSSILEVKPVHALQLDMFVECTSEYGLAYASAFVNFYMAEMDALHKRGPAAEALAIVTASAQETGTISVGFQAVEQLLNSVPPAKQLLLKFDILAEQRMEAEARAAQGLKAAVKFGPRELPIRLTDATLRKHNPKQQHPVYATTANEIGLRTPTQMDMPTVYAGSTGAFTKTFAGPYKARGLITSVTTSKVHMLLDDF